MNNIRYPHSDAELDWELHKVIWHTPLSKQPPIVQPSRLGKWVAIAAAILPFAILLPLIVLRNSPSNASVTELVEVDGIHFKYACNNGCSPEMTTAMLNHIIANTHETISDNFHAAACGGSVLSAR
ncbi:MAG: hypothetical protein IJ785_02970 [Bacteroidales bacterium]|nr:hypothetical protein [Bacteroidales bacterium]